MTLNQAHADIALLRAKEREASQVIVELESRVSDLVADLHLARAAVLKSQSTMSVDDVVINGKDAKLQQQMKEEIDALRNEVDALRSLKSVSLLPLLVKYRPH